MTSVSWRSYLPSGTSAINLGDDDIRDNFQALGSALSDEHYWSPEAGSAERGKHTPNASRVSYGSDFPASVSDLTGLMFHVDSGVSQLLIVYNDPGGSETSKVVGGSMVPYVHGLDGATLPSAGKYPGVIAQKGTVGSVLTFTRGFSDTPIVTTSIVTDQDHGVYATVIGLSAQSCDVRATDAAGVEHSGASFHIVAYGNFDTV